MAASFKSWGGEERSGEEDKSLLGSVPAAPTPPAGDDPSSYRLVLAERGEEIPLSKTNHIFETGG